MDNIITLYMQQCYLFGFKGNQYAGIVKKYEANKLSFGPTVVGEQLLSEVKDNLSN